MAKEARELAEFFRKMGDRDLADTAARLALGAEAKKLLEVDTEGFRVETLTIGTMSKQSLLRELAYKDTKMEGGLNDLIDKIRFSDQPKEVELIWRRGTDLGLKGKVTYWDLCHAGTARRGYYLNTPEVALYLRLQDIQQPSDETYWMAMNPIEIPGPTRRSGTIRYVFGLSAHTFGRKNPWLSVESTNDYCWNANRWLVFNRRPFA